MTNHLLYLFIILLSLSCENPQPKEKSYQLIWSDEFEQEDKAVDATKWFLETNAPNNGSWYNDELQHYTDRIDNAYVSEGSLKIIAKKVTNMEINVFLSGGSFKNIAPSIADSIGAVAIITRVFATLVF